ncbi:hypothetical protein PDJAM_G00139470 [Pangasius djambal]|uniref:Uncharacterized protein n=1 Tax=Pangasius djambal TaxID=1691987 RepID=A0ACC5ZF04_9TELE|nr:hypothetical protein [Pangasius djambal]
MGKVALSKTQVFLTNASLLYKDMCPEQARFLMQKQQMNGPALRDTVLCPFCFQWRRPGEYHVRLRPKCRPSVRVRKLLRREQAHKRLGSREIRLLQRFRRASTVLFHSASAAFRRDGFGLLNSKRQPDSASAEVLNRYYLML